MFFKYNFLYSVNLDSQSHKLQATPDHKNKCTQLSLWAKEVGFGVVLNQRMLILVYA